MYQFIFIIFLFFSIDGFTQLRPNYTTRLTSTAGAGVASVLLNETAFLNPASAVFFDTSSIYFQKDQGKVSNLNDQDLSHSMDSGSFLIADTSSSLKGSMSYQKRSEFEINDERFTGSIASATGKNSAVGFTYTYRTLKDDDKKLLDADNMVNMGGTYIHSEVLSFGALFQDIGRTHKEEAKATVGFQYSLTSLFILICDLETNYLLSSSDYLGKRVALQTNFFDDFFLRIGQFSDGFLKQEGHTWGLSWIGPKLSFEYAYRKSTQKEDLGFFKEDMKIVDHSFSLAVRF